MIKAYTSTRDAFIEVFLDGSDKDDLSVFKDSSQLREIAPGVRKPSENGVRFYITEDKGGSPMEKIDTLVATDYPTQYVEVNGLLVAYTERIIEGVRDNTAIRVDGLAGLVRDPSGEPDIGIEPMDEPTKRRILERLDEELIANWYSFN